MITSWCLRMLKRTVVSWNALEQVKHLQQELRMQHPVQRQVLPAVLHFVRQCIPHPRPHLSMQQADENPERYLQSRAGIAPGSCSACPHAHLSGHARIMRKYVSHASDPFLCASSGGQHSGTYSPLLGNCQMEGTAYYWFLRRWEPRSWWGIIGPTHLIRSTSQLFLNR